MISLKIFTRIIAVICILLGIGIFYINLSIEFNAAADCLYMDVYDPYFTFAALVAATIFAALFWFIELILYYVPKD